MGATEPIQTFCTSLLHIANHGQRPTHQSVQGSLCSTGTRVHSQRSLTCATAAQAWVSLI